MTKLTTKLMIATAALVVAAGAASAQAMEAAIPFEFHAGNKVMAPGTYRVDSSRLSGAPIFWLSTVHSGGSIVLLAQAPVDPEKAWQASGEGKLVFACGSGRCTLAEIYTGSGSLAYRFRGPKLDKDYAANLTVIPMQPYKSE
jgi:hypothetical protein